jgi:WD40 repeat protein
VKLRTSNLVWCWVRHIVVNPDMLIRGQWSETEHRQSPGHSDSVTNPGDSRRSFVIQKAVSYSNREEGMARAGSINAVQLTSNAESMCVSLSNGFAVLSLCPLRRRCCRIFEGQQFGNATTVHGSNIIVCTGISNQKAFDDSTVCVFDESMGRVVLEVQCKEKIGRVLMLPSMFALASRTDIRLYTFSPPVLHSQLRTAPNDYAPCDFVEADKSFLIGFTGREPGILRLVRGTRSSRQDISISSHSRPISFIKFNSTGTLVASASSLGTVIKLHNTYTSECVGQFRRGTLAAEISCMAFSPNSDILAAGSLKGTIHFFEIGRTANADPGNPVRSELKCQFPDLSGAVIGFCGVDTLVVVAKNGKIELLRCLMAEKSVVSERTESVFQALTLDR